MPLHKNATRPQRSLRRNTTCHFCHIRHSCHTHTLCTRALHTQIALSFLSFPSFLSCLRGECEGAAQKAVEGDASKDRLVFLVNTFAHHLCNAVALLTHYAIAGTPPRVLPALSSTSECNRRWYYRRLSRHFQSPQKSAWPELFMGELKSKA